MVRFAAFVLVLALFTGCQSQPGVNVERHKKLAGELRDNRLYGAAVEEYEKVLESPQLTDQERANINYLIGRIYFEDVQAYEDAAAHYVRARALDPDAGFSTELSRNLITCLERMGRSLDARRQLDRATNIEADTAAQGEVPVARIGDETIWRQDVEREIQTLPPQAQKQFSDPEARKKFLQNYVAVELIYRAAQREQIDQSPEITRQMERARKQLVVEQYVREHIMPQVQFDSSDVYNFYAANRDARYHGMPYDSVQAQVFLDYQSQKAERAYSDYIAELAEVEQVELFETNME